MISGMRRNVYGCLGLCFDYPAEVLIEDDATEIIAESFGSLARVYGLNSLALEVGCFRKALSNGGKSNAARLLELQVEYNRLFAGPREPLVYPCESIFLEAYRRGTTGGQYLAQARFREGLGLAWGFKELPDYISAEFEFIAHLCSKEIETGEAGRHEAAFEYGNKREAFMKEHVIVWVPAFLQIIERATTSDFYRSLARIAREFISWDYKRLSEIKGQSAGLAQS